MEYKSRPEMVGNYSKLQVGDTAPSGHQCLNCGIGLICVYAATGEIANKNHNLVVCIQNLNKRISDLEERIESFTNYVAEIIE